MNDEKSKVFYSRYDRQSKWLGILDYKSLTFLVIYIAIIWNILKLINISVSVMIYIFCFLTIPVICVIIVNNNSESSLDVALVIIKYFYYSKIYVKDIEYVKCNKKIEKYKKLI